MTPYILLMLSPTTYHRRSSETFFYLCILIIFRHVLCSLGGVDMGTVQKVKIEITDEQRARQERFRSRPPLSEILNLHDFEVFHSSHYNYTLIQRVEYCAF